MRRPPLTYPRSRGHVLRHIGKDLEVAVELLLDHGFEILLSFVEKTRST